MRSPLIWIGAAAAALIFAWVALAILQTFASVSDETAVWVLAISAAAGLFSAMYLSGSAPRSAADPKQFPWWQYVLLGLLPMAVLAIGGVIYASVASSGAGAEAPIVVLLFAGVAGLLLALAVVAVFFAGLGLNDEREALGLPRGSIRAVIALALILIFAALSVYLHAAVDENDPAAANDLAEQLVTIVSTLVVAIASFYFGSNAVQTATDSVTRLRNDPDLVVSVEDPKPKLKKNDDGTWTPESIPIQVTTHPGGLKVAAAVFGDSKESIEASGDGYTYKPQSPTPPVLIRFTLVSNAAVNAEIEFEAEDSGTAAGVVTVSGGGEDEGTGGGSRRSPRRLRMPFEGQS